MSEEVEIKVYNSESDKEESNYDEDQVFASSCSMKSETETQKLVKFSFVVTNEEVHVSYFKLKDLILNALCSHPYFSKIGQIWQTFERGVNFPVIHYLPVNNLDNYKYETDERSRLLGNNFTLYEGLYEEIERIELPVIASDTRQHQATSYKTSSQTNQPYLSNHAYIFLGFKTLDTTFNSVLEESWKDWTGARRLYLNLSSDFGLSKICFYRRILPNELNTFMYIVIADCTNINDKNRIMLLDFVDRFRLQRLCGYLTVYTNRIIPDAKHNSISSSFDSSESQSVLEVINQEVRCEHYLPSITPIDI